MNKQLFSKNIANRVRENVMEREKNLLVNFSNCYFIFGMSTQLLSTLGIESKIHLDLALSNLHHQVYLGGQNLPNIFQNNCAFILNSSLKLIDLFEMEIAKWFSSEDYISKVFVNQFNREFQLNFYNKLLNKTAFEKKQLILNDKTVPQQCKLLITTFAGKCAQLSKNYYELLPCEMMDKYNDVELNSSQYRIHNNLIR